MRMTLKQRRAEYQRKQANLRRARKESKAHEKRREWESALKKPFTVTSPRAPRLASGGMVDVAWLEQRRGELEAELAFIMAQLLRAKFESYCFTGDRRKRPTVERGWWARGRWRGA
jgi:hypothetical protein